MNRSVNKMTKMQMVQGINAMYQIRGQGSGGQHELMNS